MIPDNPMEQTAQRPRKIAVMTDQAFDIRHFNPAAHILLGEEGLWGRVYDLGDGTVLKLACETCSGMGSGREKIAVQCGRSKLNSASVIPNRSAAEGGIFDDFNHIRSLVVLLLGMAVSGICKINPTRHPGFRS